MKLYTKSRDNLYDATAAYDGKTITVFQGSRINLLNSKGFKPPKQVADIRNDRNIVNADGRLLKNVKFKTLSTAATFVTGRIANGMIVWKTEDGKYVRYSLEKGNDNG